VGDFYGWWGFKTASKILLGNIVWLLFRWLSEYTNDNHLNDNQTIFPNKIFDAVLNPHQPQKSPTDPDLQSNHTAHHTTQAQFLQILGHNSLCKTASASSYTLHNPTYIQ
jgi:hypothetical protein